MHVLKASLCVEELSIYGYSTFAQVDARQFQTHCQDESSLYYSPKHDAFLLVEKLRRDKKNYENVIITNVRRDTYDAYLHGCFS